jgi:hypothetical protein
MCPFEEHLFRLSNSILNCLLWILREVVVPNDQLMQLIPEKVCTCSTSMTIIDGKEAASGPLIDLLELWLYNIEDYANSIFIIVPDNSLMRIGGVTTDDTVLFAGEFGGVITLFVSFNLLLLHFNVFLLLLHRHDEPSIGYELILTFALNHRLFFNFFGASSWWLRLAVSLVISCS